MASKKANAQVQRELPGGFPLPASFSYIGVDEAGRGCLAGPVVAAAVFCPEGFEFSGTLAGLADSKTVSQAKREGLALALKASSLPWAVGVASAWEVDALNVLQATFRAMSRAAATLLARIQETQIQEPRLLLDGNQTIPPAVWKLESPERPLPRQQAVVKGDALVKGISAASILAKTERDNMMRELDQRFPGYDFSAHKGYGTKAHLEALQKCGPCPEHRRSFAGVPDGPEQTAESGLRQIQPALISGGF